MTAQRKPCIIVHGGAGTISSARRISSLSAVKEAVKAGYNVLLEVRSSLQLTRRHGGHIGVPKQ